MDSTGTRAYSRSNKGDGAQDAKEQARQDAERLADEARHQTQATVNNQKHAAADQAGGLADALRKTSDELNTQHQTYLAHYANRCAASLDRMAGSLRDKDTDTLIGQTQDFIRRQPGLFLGGAVTAGFVLSRFLKSSESRRHTGDGLARSSRSRTDGSSFSRSASRG